MNYYFILNLDLYYHYFKYLNSFMNFIFFFILLKIKLFDSNLINSYLKIKKK